jgi:hypothetical protein
MVRTLDVNTLAVDKFQRTILHWAARLDMSKLIQTLASLDVWLTGEDSEG